MAERRTTRRSAPIPGTVRRRERLVASCCVAVWRIDRSMARRRWSSWPITARSTAMRLLYCGSGQALGDAGAVGGVGARVPKRGERVLPLASFGCAPAVPPAGAGEASAAGARRGWRASPRERQTPRGACPRAGAQQSAGHHAGRVWPSPRGSPAARAHGPAHRAYRHGPRGQRATTRCSATPRPPHEAPERGPWPGDTVLGPPAGAGARGARHPGARRRETGCGHAERCHSNMGAVSWSIACGLRLVPA